MTTSSGTLTRRLLHPPVALRISLGVLGQGRARRGCPHPQSAGMLPVRADPRDRAEESGCLHRVPPGTQGVPPRRRRQLREAGTHESAGIPWAVHRVRSVEQGGRSLLDY